MDISDNYSIDDKYHIKFKTAITNIKLSLNEKLLGIAISASSEESAKIDMFYLFIFFLKKNINYIKVMTQKMKKTFSSICALLKIYKKKYNLLIFLSIINSFSTNSPIAMSQLLLISRN